MNRVTATSIREAWLQSMRQTQSNLARTQMQVSTGERFSRPAEDPVAATRVLELNRSLESNAQLIRNGQLARNRLSLEESVLVQVADSMDRLRELALQANNDSQTNETRAAIAKEARQHLEALLQFGNAQDGNGQYLFSGYASRTRPFSQSAGGVVYDGDDGVRQLQIGPDRRIADSDPGSELFMRIRNGNGTFVVDAGAGNTGTGVVGDYSVTDPTAYDADTYTITFTSASAYEVRDSANALVTSGAYTTGQSIAFVGAQVQLSGAPAAGDTYTAAPSQNQAMFQTVQNFIDALEGGVSGEVSRAELHNSLNRVVHDMDQVLARVVETRSGVGSRLAAIETQTAVNTDLDVELKTLISDLKDLDYAEALSRLEQQLTSLEAAQKSYALMQNASLFNYL